MKAAALLVLVLGADPGFSRVWDPEPVRLEPRPRSRRVVLLTASWCPPCKQLAAQLPGLSRQGWTSGAGPQNHIQLVDIDAEPERWERWRKPDSTSVPQAVYLENEKPVRWLVGPSSAAAVTWFFYGRDSGRPAGPVVSRSDPDFSGVFR